MWEIQLVISPFPGKKEEKTKPFLKNKKWVLLVYKFGKAVALSRFVFFLSSFICFFIFSYCFRCCMICDSSIFISKTEFPFFPPFLVGKGSE